MIFSSLYRKITRDLLELKVLCFRKSVVPYRSGILDNIGSNSFLALSGIFHIAFGNSSGFPSSVSLDFQYIGLGVCQQGSNDQKVTVRRRIKRITNCIYVNRLYNTFSIFIFYRKSIMLYICVVASLLIFFIISTKSISRSIINISYCDFELSNGLSFCV